MLLESNQFLSGYSAVCSLYTKHTCLSTVSVKVVYEGNRSMATLYLLHPVKANRVCDTLVKSLRKPGARGGTQGIHPGT